MLSKVSVYLAVPCSIINAFQVTYTDEVRDGLLLAYLGALLTMVTVIVIMRFLSPALHLNDIEKVSVIYSNAGNLVIPLVSSVLGEEWVIYSSAYLSVFLVFMWSHGKMIICGEKKPDIKKIVTNINMIAIAIGLIFFITQIQLPSPIKSAVSSLGAMTGPMAMLVTGMLNANTDIKKILSYHKIWLVAGLRLVAVPLVSLAILKYSGIAALVHNGSQILLITMIATITPSASNVVQMAQVYNKDAAYAGAINVVTTLMCLITMPIMIYLYQM